MNHEREFWDSAQEYLTDAEIADPELFYSAKSFCDRRGASYADAYTEDGRWIDDTNYEQCIKDWREAPLTTQTLTT